MDRCCFECRHYQCADIDDWRTQFCKAAPLPLIRNWVTGREETAIGNEFVHCRTVNSDGNCVLFSQIIATKENANA